MALADDLKTISSDLDTIKAVVESAAAGLDAPAEPSVGDKVLADLVATLLAAGYTVTPPAPAEVPETPSETADAEDVAEGAADATPSPDGDTTDTPSTEAPAA